jgi:hypothetical protein
MSPLNRPSRACEEYISLDSVEKLYVEKYNKESVRRAIPPPAVDIVRRNGNKNESRPNHTGVNLK